MTENAYYLPTANEVELFSSAARNKLPVLIKGPTGCGKTRFVAYMAEKLERPLYTVACHDDLSASDLVGRHLVSHNGTYWQDGPLTRAVREGAICYLDEIVEARKDTTVILHPLADTRRELPLERTGEILQAHEDFLLVVSYNPGYQNLMKGMKPSTRQRFIAIDFDYPEQSQEAAIVMSESGTTKGTAQQLIRIAQALRRLENHDIEEAPSTRLAIYAAQLFETGITLRDACIAALVLPLTDDKETIKALTAVVEAYTDESL